MKGVGGNEEEGVVSVCGLRGDVALFYFYLRRFSRWFRDQVSELQVLNLLYVYDSGNGV
jgi:hypothetical protein